jgi:two-component system cell cycle sensor histidine kinase/response regulator CckA
MSVRTKTILLVDDEAPLRERMRRALRTASYRVLAASDYGAAVASFQQHSGVIDMLVTDLALPGKNGYELALSLRAIQPKLKVLFTSALVGAELHRFYGMTSTDEHFLQKPFQPVDLVRRVRYLMERAEPMAGSASG